MALKIPTLPKDTWPTEVLEDARRLVYDEGPARADRAQMWATLRAMIVLYESLAKESDTADGA